MSRSYALSLIHFAMSSFFVILLFSMANKTHAEKMKDLYSASWPIADQSGEARKRGLANVFAQVLVRASGNPNIARNSGVRANLANAEDYLRQYSYKKLSFEEQRIYRQPLLLVASFEPQAVINVLKDNGQPIWSDNRPAGTFWIAVEENSARRVASERQDAVVIAIKRAAERRGLPVTIPLMDLEDQNALTPSDVWGAFNDKISAASQRYNSEYFAMGRLSVSNGRWQGRWVVDFGSENMRFSTSGNSSEQAVNKMLDKVADRMADKLAVVLSNQSEKAYVVIQDLATIETYAKSYNFMKNLSIVSNVNAIQVREGSILFELTLQSSPHYLYEAMNISKHLKAVAYDNSFTSNSLSGEPLSNNLTDRVSAEINNVAEDDTSENGGEVNTSLLNNSFSQEDIRQGYSISAQASDYDLLFEEAYHYRWID